MSKIIQENTLSVLPGKPFYGTYGMSLPYVSDGDETFGLSTKLLRPCGRHNISEERNVQLCRARRFIDCMLSVPPDDWRILHRTENVSTEFAQTFLHTS